MKCLLLAALLLSSLLLVAGGVAWLGNSADTLERIRTTGIIKIVYAVEAPYAFVRPDGEVSGEASEIARQIVKGLNIPRIEWRQVEFGNLITELEAGRIDVIAAGLFITPERARRVLFSEPTFFARPALLVAGGNPKQLRSYRQAAEQPSLRIAVLAGAVDEKNLRRLGVADERVLRVPDALTGRRAVETGLADALMLSEPTLRWMARQAQLGHTELVIVSAQDNVEASYGHPAFAFRLRDQSLQEAWNSLLHEYLGSAQHRELMMRLGLTLLDAQPEAGER